MAVACQGSGQPSDLSSITSTAAGFSASALLICLGLLDQGRTPHRAAVRLRGCDVAGLQLRQAEEREAAQEAWQTQGHVFTMEDGPAARYELCNPAIPEAPKGSGEALPPLTFHGLRHCHASLMLASGADLAVVSKLLGHKSITITADIYGHLIGTVASDAVNGAANLIAHT
jgi:integrase